MDEYNKGQKKFTPNQAQSKAEYYCAYQERSQQEVRDKLYSWGLYESEVENIIAYLIEENFLNEERFAHAFTLGKFRINGWGKIKIKQHLQFKRVSPPILRQALSSIDLDEYEEKLKDIIKKKIGKSPNNLPLTERTKLYRFLLSRGFEPELILQQLNSSK
ncbi:regulatory protein RecX [Sphingobacterium sp. UT-1RO-CII-1]|uniref:regulatory protein RecX n=1 Tax=Sphingobacterium sp. UT-1RO-CII-1 TaxID=2995225 RepID=UPI00227AFE48|nr:regulatory protein RecX [Sphingobacterium sp. UT-1RO-CII-1]MCY4781232.1 regulatory protein RecX [Sphingobacterium sp. UT-1RO-CII-1]